MSFDDTPDFFKPIKRTILTAAVVITYGCAFATVGGFTEVVLYLHILLLWITFVYVTNYVSKFVFDPIGHQLIFQSTAMFIGSFVLSACLLVVVTIAGGAIAHLLGLSVLVGVGVAILLWFEALSTSELGKSLSIQLDVSPHQAMALMFGFAMFTLLILLFLLRAVLHEADRVLEFGSRVSGLLSDT